MRNKIFFISVLLLMHVNAQAKDFIVTGTVTDTKGAAISGASVIMKSGKLEFRSVSGKSGDYSLRISGLYGNISGLLESGIPYPNPFTNQVKVPFIINSKGDIRFTVYSLQGQKINEILFAAVEPGSYNIAWNGCSAYGSPVATGFYIYAVSFRGEIRSGRLIKAVNEGSGRGATTLEQVMTPQINVQTSSLPSLDVITSVTATDFNGLRITDITIRSDTVIDFELSSRSDLPFKTNTDHIAVLTSSGYKSMILKGINLGSSPPGTFPGEIAYAISAENYEKWISRIGKAGFNCIRVYTLHPPVFYEKLANYNFRHREKPIYLFQGIWLDEPESRTDMDLITRSEAFTGTIQENIDCIHGNRNIDLRPGKAYGNYRTDISEWTAGYIIGREISPFEIKATNQLHPSMTSFKGFQFGIESGSPSEVFIAQMLDEVVRYENLKYRVFRPASFSSWPTLDPLTHPTETNSDEDAASFDVYKIKGKSENAGLFATYHAYPYYPNFISM